MIWLVVALAVSLALCIFWVQTAKPVSYTVLELRGPLVAALQKLQRKGDGFVSVDAGGHFLQFCLRPGGGGVIVVDLPAPQLQEDSVVAEVLRMLDFKPRGTEHFLTYQKELRTAEQAAVAAAEVFGAVFEWEISTRVTLDTDFRKLR